MTARISESSGPVSHGPPLAPWSRPGWSSCHWSSSSVPAVPDTVVASSSPSL
ncbi:hypothetical protein [Pseudonocardia sp. ICBG601]|uniref:hypothetical protein n=1 Tax=Pseudonocardia sp. ICBG601 TaxID=2846759 RepID=UPI0021F59593|nr:hypothetical protein [Pseudonocardia sp. ICBG601]